MPLLTRRRRGLMQPENPDRSPLGFRDELERVFDEFFRGWPTGSHGMLSREFIPPVDVTESDGEVQVTVELPGMTESDVSVELDEDLLTISGEKKEREEKEEEGGRCWREACYGKFVRQVPLPAEVESENAEARFKNGRLTVTVPKIAEAKQKRRKLEIKGEQ